VAFRSGVGWDVADQTSRRTAIQVTGALSPTLDCDVVDAGMRVRAGPSTLVARARAPAAERDETMAQTVADVVTPDPVTLEASRTVRDAAELMRAGDIGDVVVVEDGRLVGIVTDRDLVVRVLAVGGGPDDAIRQAVSGNVVTVSPTESIERAAQLMSENAVRRLPVVVDDVVVGIVSIGDLAIERDPDSALADISVAEPNT